MLVSEAMAHRRLDALLNTNGRLRSLGDCEILELGFYDGPKSGVILFPDDGPLKLSTIGTRYEWGLRAFHLAPLSRGWEARASALASWVDARRTDNPKSVSDVLPDGEYEHLERELESAATEGHYVAVGDNWLSRFLIAPVSEEDVAMFNAMNEPAGYSAARRFVKQYRDALGDQ